MNTHEVKIKFFVDSLRDDNSVMIRTETVDQGYICTLCQCETRELAEAMVKNLECAKGRVYRRAAAFEEAIL